MKSTLMLRQTTRQDLPKLPALYPQALPEEDLKPVVSAQTDGLPDILSIAGFNLDASVAHVLFTICGTDPDDRSGALLAPLGVMPSHRRQGHGTALVHEGLKRLRARGTGRAFVLGDPDHYRRLGFTVERKSLPPYGVSEDCADAWRSLSLHGKAQMSERRRLPEP